MTAKYPLKILKSLLILAFCSLLSVALDGWGIRAENIMMIFLMGVIIVIVETGSLILGLAASLVLVSAFNFLFTEPRYTFIVDDPNYFVTFGIFLAVSLISSALASNLQRQAERAAANERCSSLLYEISSGSFLIAGSERVIQFSAGKLAQAFGREIFVALADATGVLSTIQSCGPDGTAALAPIVDEAATWTYRNCACSGAGTDTFADKSWRYYPLKTGNDVYGSLGVHCGESALSESESLVVGTIAAQIAAVIERERLVAGEERSRLEIERERLRNALLRSISHDLRTPLTAIGGSAGVLLDNYDSLERPTVISLIRDIGIDCAWLSNMVENLLNMTRMQDGKLVMKTSAEIADELVEEAVTRVRRLLGDRPLSVSLPDTALFVEVDPVLFTQVLVNLLDNAIKHTGPMGAIAIEVAARDGIVAFTVRDDGPGIAQSLLSTIFDGNGESSRTEGRRGMGLGLSICRAIVSAHGGTVEAGNNQAKGAYFTVRVPCAPDSGAPS